MSSKSNTSPSQIGDYAMTAYISFNILFGLFTKEERTLFLEHISQDNGMWFM